MLVMAKEATLQVRMDSELKEQVELLYKNAFFHAFISIQAEKNIGDCKWKI